MKKTDNAQDTIATEASSTRYGRTEAVAAGFSVCLRRRRMIHAVPMMSSGQTR